MKITIPIAHVHEPNKDTYFILILNTPVMSCFFVVIYKTLMYVALKPLCMESFSEIITKSSNVVGLRTL